MKKPLSIIFALILNYIQITKIVLSAVLFMAVASIPMERRGDFPPSVANIPNLTSFQLGEIVGATTIPLFIVIFTLVNIHQRKYKATIICIVFQILMAASKPLNMIIPIIMMITASSTSSKDYLKNRYN